MEQKKPMASEKKLAAVQAAAKRKAEASVNQLYQIATDLRAEVIDRDRTIRKFKYENEMLVKDNAALGVHNAALHNHIEVLLKALAAEQSKPVARDIGEVCASNQGYTFGIPEREPSAAERHLRVWEQENDVPLLVT